MPPPESQGQSFWNQAVDAATGVISRLTGQHKSAEKDGVGSRDSTNDVHDLTSDEPEIVEHSTKKRRVLERVEVSRKKQDTRTADERRLIPDYSTPSDAIPLGSPRMPGSIDGAVSDQIAGTTHFKSAPRPSRGFKPTNTLDQPSRHVTALNRSHPRFAGESAARGSYGSASAVKRARETGDAVYGLSDAFDRGERSGPASKRRRVGLHSQQELGSDPIVDENGDGEVVEVKKVNGRMVGPNRRVARTQAAVHDSKRTAPFESNEHKHIDDLVRTTERKPRRRPMEGARSRQGSSQASPANSMNGHSTKAPKDVVDLVDDDPPQKIRMNWEPTSSAGDALPDPKAIAANLDEYAESKRKRLPRESQDSVELVHAHSKAPMPPPSTNDHHVNSVQKPIAQQRQRRHIRQDDGDRNDLTKTYIEDKERRRSKEPEQRLAKTFVRAGTSTPRPANRGTSQRWRMKAESGPAGAKAVPARDSLGSVDELAGPTTVGSVSPLTQQTERVQTLSHVNASRTSRSRSPSDLRPTPFMQSRQVQKSTTSVKRKNDETGDERFQVRLTAFCSASCILREGDGDIKLCYNEGENEFDIVHNDDLKVIPGLQDYVRIGQAEAKQVYFSAGSPFIYLKGSSDMRSGGNGRICIALADASDVQWFYVRLMAIAGDALVTKAETKERMRDIFIKQEGDIAEAAKKRRKASLVDDTISTHPPSMQRQGVHKDEIQYETEAWTRPNRRRGMKGEEIIDNDPRSVHLRPSERYEQSRFFSDGARRRSIRQSKQKSPSPSRLSVVKWTKVHKPAKWSSSVVYPPEGIRRVTVDFQDLERLDEGEFLNDNLISFALRRIEESMALEHKERVHFFNSFFYTSLTTKNGKKGFNYDAVKRWTKSKDLLGCDYVVVPINIDLHWFVAIICNLPNLSRTPVEGDEVDQNGNPEDVPVASGSHEATFDAVEAPAVADAEQSGGETLESTRAMHHLSISDDESPAKTTEQAGQDDNTATPGTGSPKDAEPLLTLKKPSTTATRKGKKRGPPSYDAEKPAIITLDSFALPHAGEVRQLKDYISAEAEAKRGMNVDRDKIQGLNVKDSKVPTQPNFCDCGVYLVRYVEEFAKDPREFVTNALHRKLGHADEFAGFDPSQKRDEIREELLKLHTEQDAEHKAKKAGKKAGKKAAKSESTTATPTKPESDSPRKSLSSAVEAIQPAKSPTPPRQRQATPSQKAAEAFKSVTKLQASQDKDLEFEVPRALGSHARPASDYAQEEEQNQDESVRDEMLDDKQVDPTLEAPGICDDTRPTELLANLEAAVHRNSQQSEEGFLVGVVEAAADNKSPGHKIADAALDGQEAAMASTRRASSEGVETIESDDDDTDEGGPGEIGEQDVIDLGDEEDELRKQLEAEIPDSQEQSQGRPRAAMTGAWSGEHTKLRENEQWEGLSL